MNCGSSEIFEHTRENKKMINLQIRDQRKPPVTPNKPEHIETLKKEIRYLRNESITKTSITKLLT